MNNSYPQKHNHGEDIELVPLSKKTKPKKGFTLLEVILALSIMSILIGSIFTITNSSILLSQSIVQNQSDYRHQAALDNYLSTLLIDLPYDARCELIQEADGLQYLTIQNPGTSFPYLQNEFYAQYINLSTSKNRDGLLELSIAFSNSNNSENLDLNEIEYQQSFVLLSDLSSIQWQIYSIRDSDWYPTWSFDLGRPSHIKIAYQSVGDSQTHTRTYWIPPKAKIR